jgi:antitoxin component YwqK of YwqJK toxin-antitoxin module
MRPLANGGVEYRIGKRVVARAYFHATGEIDWAVPFDDNGRMHGVERHDFEDGRRMYRARWRHGKQVGWQEQWDERGRLLVRQRFVRGTGLDVWFTCGEIAETRTYVDGARHGYERWGHGKHVHEESHFRADREHGVFRSWNIRGRLRRGYPQYWIDGQRVTKRVYLRQAAIDPSLPAFDRRDDRPVRAPPRPIMRRR